MLMFEVIFHLVAPLLESEPSREFIQVIHGEIRDSESNVTVGRITSSLVQVGRVADAGEDLFDVIAVQISGLTAGRSGERRPVRG